MAVILCIETATETCSVSIAENGITLALKELNEGNQHAAQLTSLIGEMLKESGMDLKKLDAIAVSKGPGSYTGLRIGVATAKGLCFGLGIPLLAIPTLRSLAANFLNKYRKDVAEKSPAYLVPMLDARRMEVYTAVYTPELETVLETEAKIIHAESFQELLNQRILFFFGNGAAKCEPVIQHQQAVFVHALRCSAEGMSELAEQAFQQKQFEDLAYFEPFYLKDFVAR